MEKVNIEELRGLEKGSVAGIVKIEKYIPVESKIKAAESIVQNLVQLQEDGTYAYDYVARRMAEAISVVQLYTNVKVTEDVYLNYDLIMQSGLLDLIASDCDVELFFNIVNDKITEAMDKNSINHIFSRSMDNMYGTLDMIAKHFNDMLDKGDPNKIAKYLSKGIETIANKMPDFSTLDINKQLEGQLDRKKMN